jgi:GT2 family glycosyltransferase
VIVIDGSKSSPIRARFESECLALGARYSLACIGIARARNIGIRIANGRIVVFLDDDIVVTRAAIRNLVAHYASPRVAACPGRIVSLRDDWLSRLFEKYSSYDRGVRGYEVGRNDMNVITLLKSGVAHLVGSSVKVNPPPYSLSYGLYSFRKGVLENLGGFDENLGRGTPQRGGEDVDMYYRILRHGYVIVYEPRSIAYHDHKHSFEEMLDQAYSNGCSIAALAKKHLRTDPYPVLMLFGDILRCILTSLRATLQGAGELRKLSQARLAGISARIIRPPKTLESDLRLK